MENKVELKVPVLSFEANPKPLPGKSLIEGWMDSQWRNFVETAEHCKTKEVEDLTEEEKFALAICAGVRIAEVQPSEDGLSMRMRTQKCDIQKRRGGGFFVFVPQSREAGTSDHD